ncbi:MAG: alanine--tRNA ligase, partial [Oscillospiraceae bacterium]|nr:alanine--tRNA ligase [Candidatus Equicaccousia limihippi]
CDCDRYVEFWNLVFTQFDSDGKGNYTPLAHPNIDTGMGLERLACILQGVDNIFEVDTVQNIMKELSKKAGVEYKKDEKLDVSLRVITDHIRSTTMMLGDGVMPSNEGRGYVLRRLLRRAARHGRLLGIKEPFLYQLCDTVIDEYRTAYPELVEKQEVIKKIILVEEESFGKTIDQGLNMLNDLMKGDIKELSGADAFKLYDTYGFPLDLTKDILEEKGITVNEQEFNVLMDEQKKRARDSRKNSHIDGWKEAGDFLDGISATEFVGYENDRYESVVVALSGDNIVLDKTPFYAESGGQVADKGVIECSSGIFEVSDVTKTPAGVFVHTGKYISGEFSKGDKVVAKIDADRRN